MLPDIDPCDADDGRDMPTCFWRVPVEFRPIPGWPRYRVGSNRSVWVDRTRPGLPPPWNRPRWFKLKPRRLPGRGPAVKLRHEGRGYYRSVEMLHRATFGPGADLLDWAARVGPRAGSGASLRRIRPLAPAPVPAPVPSAIAATHRPAPMPSRVPAIAVSVARDCPPPPIVEDDRAPARPVRGSAHGRARLTEESVAEARRLKAEGWSYPALARRYGVNRVTLFYAISGRTWSHVPMEDHPGRRGR